jgi:hypothetical protein
MTTIGLVRRALTPHRRLAVAVLVVALLLTLVGGAVLLVFPAAALALTGPTATTEANGLVFTLRVAPGPYFLRELLPVGISLTNHSHTTLYMEGYAGMHRFGAAFQVTEEGGGAPQYQIPSLPLPWSYPPPQPTGLAPGQTLSTSALLPFTGSGHLTLSAGVSVYTVTLVSGGGMNFGSGSDPFAGRGPTLHLTVAASVPPNRTVGLWQIWTRLLVLAPPQAVSHLVSWNGFDWQPITTFVLDEHVCNWHDGNCVYVIGAPGYALAMGSTASIPEPYGAEPARGPGGRSL